MAYAYKYITVVFRPDASHAQMDQQIKEISSEADVLFVDASAVGSRTTANENLSPGDDTKSL